MMASEQILGVALALACAFVEGFGQLAFKVAAVSRRARIAGVAVGVALFLVQAGLYAAALRFIPVGVAFTIGSASLVVAVALSRRLSHETVDARRWCGVALIAFGAALVAVGA